MEILVVSHKYPPSIGGMQKQCFELVEGLKKNHTVHELILHSGTSKVLFLLTAALKAKWYLVRNRKVQLVYANDGLMAFFLTPLFWMTKVPIAITLHGLDVVFPLAFYQRWIRKYLNRACAIIPVSQGTTEELLSREVREALIYPVKNGFDPGGITVSPSEDHKLWLEKKLGISLKGKKVIVSIGRSVKRKGFSWLVSEVIPKLGEDVVYLIIGPTLGDYDKVSKMRNWLPGALFDTWVLLDGVPLDEIEVHQKIDALGLDQKVFHLNDLTNEKVKSTLGVSDLFVMPNLSVPGDYEGFGLVALEAVSAGLVCVASKVDGIPSAIEHEQNGLLLPSADVEAYINTLTVLLANDDKRKKMAKQFMEYSKTHCLSWKEMATGYEEVFTKVLKEKA